MLKMCWNCNLSAPYIQYRSSRKIDASMHPAAFSMSYKTSLAEISIINSYYTRIIILPMVVTMFASQVLPPAVHLCSICLTLVNANVITRGRTLTSAMSVRCYEVIHQVARRRHVCISELRCLFLCVPLFILLIVTLSEAVLLHVAPVGRISE